MLLPNDRILPLWNKLSTTIVACNSFDVEMSNVTKQHEKLIVEISINGIHVIDGNSSTKPDKQPKSKQNNK